MEGEKSIKNCLTHFVQLLTFILAMIFCLTNVAVAYNVPKKLLLNIQFDSAPEKNIYGLPFHVNTTLTIDVDQQKNYLVATHTDIIKNFPVTLAMLVKTVAINDEQTSLEFNFVHYGYLRSGILVLQPRLVLKNGQSGEINTELFTLKASANWEPIADKPLS